MDPLFYSGIALAAFLGAILQGTVGFAFGAFAIPCFVWCGATLQEAIALVLVVNIVQTGLAAYSYRGHIAWSDVIPATCYRLVALPVGVWLLGRMSDSWTPGQIKQFIGLAILLTILVQLFCRPRPRSAVHPIWLPIAGATSGFCAGLVGIGGPPIVFWAAAHDWSTQRTRAFLWMLFFIAAAPQLTIMRWRFGAEIGEAGLLGAAFIPLVVAGSWLGTRLGDRLSRSRLRWITYVILLLVALASILDPALR